MMSFLSFLLFDYEFNFFYLISFRKNKQQIVNDNQAEIINMLRKENNRLLEENFILKNINTNLKFKVNKASISFTQ